MPGPSGCGVHLPCRLPCLRRHDFVWSRLLASVRGLSQRRFFSSPAVLVVSLCLMGVVSSHPGSSVFVFPQSAPVFSCCGFSEFIHLILLSRAPRLPSPLHSRLPSPRHRPSSASPSRASVWVRFTLPSPSSTLLSHHPLHGGTRGRLPRLALLSLGSSWVFLFLVPSRGADACAGCLSSGYFSCSHSSLAVPLALGGFSFISSSFHAFSSLVGLLQVSFWLLVLSVCGLSSISWPFLWLSLQGGLLWVPFVCSGLSFPLSLVLCVCLVMVPSSFLLPSSLSASSLEVLCPSLPFGCSSCRGSCFYLLVVTSSGVP